MGFTPLPLFFSPLSRTIDPNLKVFIYGGSGHALSSVSSESFLQAGLKIHVKLNSYMLTSVDFFAQVVMVCNTKQQQ